MTFLPIVARELRVASRRRATYWGRFSAAILAVVAGAWILLWAQSEAVPQKDMGQILFSALAVLVFGYIALAGVLLTCDCLSMERREGTLGLLFLTDLRGYDVVFGKLAASSLNACYGILAVLPVLAIPLLLGGVTNGEFWRVALVAANLLFFFLSIGIFASSICREDQRSMAVAAIIALAILLASPLAEAIIVLQFPGFNSELIWLPCPAFDCLAAFEKAFKSDPRAFWENAVITQIYAWTFLFLACRIVPRSWHDAAAGPKRSKLAALAPEDATARAVRRAILLTINPFLWRATGSRGKMIRPWLFLGFAVIAWYGGGKLFGASSLFEEPYDAFAAVTVHLVFKLWVAAEACRCLASDLRTGGLELLLTTPLTGDEILRGQRKALGRQFIGPMTAVLLFDFLFMLMAVSNVDDSDERTGWVLFYVVTAIFFVLDMNALSWISMKLGLTGRKPNRVVIISYCIIVVAPAVLSLLGLVLFRGGGVGGFAMLWIIPAMLLDQFVIFGLRAGPQFQQFREGASRPLKQS